MLKIEVKYSADVDTPFASGIYLDGACYAMFEDHDATVTLARTLATRWPNARLVMPEPMPPGYFHAPVVQPHAGQEVV